MPAPIEFDVLTLRVLIFPSQVWMCNVCRRRRGTFAAPELLAGEFLPKRRVSALVCHFLISLAPCP